MSAHRNMIRILRRLTLFAILFSLQAPLTTHTSGRTHTHTHTHHPRHPRPPFPPYISSTTVSSAQAAEDYVLSRDSARKLLAVFGGITASELNERYEEFALFGNGQKTLDRAGFGRMVKHCASLSKVGNKSAERLVESKQFIDRCVVDAGGVRVCGCADGPMGRWADGPMYWCVCVRACVKERGR